LVADFPGLTRDRLYGYCSTAHGSAVIVDTGGLSGNADPMSVLMARQVDLAIVEADVVVLLVEASAGVTPGDIAIAESLRKSGKNLIVAVNKAEGLAAAETAAEFWSLGMGEPQVISALRGDRVNSLIDLAVSSCDESDATVTTPEVPNGLRIAVVGRPNVGKSTLINRYLGEERLLASDQAGTTRDSIYVPFSVQDTDYVLVDTAGIRRRSKVTEGVEKFSIVKSLAAIESADAVMLLLDAYEGVTEQDVSLAGLVLERGRALTLGINKWDGLSRSERNELRNELDRRLPFLDYVDRQYISAVHGSNVYDLLGSATRSAACAVAELPTSRLTALLASAIEAHPPPLVRGRRPKLSYAHQGGRNPPVIVIHGNQTNRLPDSYRRYLVNYFRSAFHLVGTPLRLQLVNGRNPFAGRRNRLTPRQEKKRKRLRKYVKR